LACGVPDLEFDVLLSTGERPGPEFDSDRQVMGLLEPFVGELEQETTLPDAGVSNDNELKNVAVRLRLHCL
jgi:hypothetical protein